MGTGAQIVFMGVNGGEEGVECMTGVRPNGPEQAIVCSAAHDFRRGSSEREVAKALRLADEALNPVPLPSARVPPPGW